MTPEDFLEVVKTSRRKHFPVLHAETGEFAGILELVRVRALLLDPALARVTLVGTVMDPDVPGIPLDAWLMSSRRPTPGFYRSSTASASLGCSASRASSIIIGASWSRSSRRSDGTE